MGGHAVITGGAGFIGSHLCERFLREGYDVTAIDNFLTGSRRNLEHLSAHPGLRLVPGDITQPVTMERRVDLILHFASPASPADYRAHPIHTMKVDSIGAFYTLGLAKAHGARYLLASTSEIYGDPLEHPQREVYWGNVNPVGPRSVYDEAKRFGEALAMAYHRVHATDVRIARIFNTYGPRMIPSGAVPTSPERAGYWATIRGSPWRKACAGRSRGLPQSCSEGLLPTSESPTQYDPQAVEHMFLIAGAPRLI